MTDTRLRLWHGGAPDLRAGDLITPHEPHYVDGCAFCEAKRQGGAITIDGHAVDPPAARPNRVYVTTDREYAAFYASQYPRGDLYRVETTGELEPSTEDIFPTWTVPAARVTAVYRRAIQLTNSQRRALLRRWPDIPPAVTR